MEFSYCLFIRTNAFPDLSYQPRIRDQPSSIHEAASVWKTLCNPLIISCRKQIPIIAKWHFQTVYSLLISSEPRHSAIHICLNPWVDDQFMNGIFFINGQQILPVFLVVSSNSGLYGNFHIKFRKNLIQELIQLLGLCQKSGTLSLRCNCSRRTTKIQVHFLVSVIIFQKLGSTDKIICIAGQDLGNHIHSLIPLR